MKLYNPKLHIKEEKTAWNFIKREIIHVVCICTQRRKKEQQQQRREKAIQTENIITFAQLRYFHLFIFFLGLWQKRSSSK